MNLVRTSKEVVVASFEVLSWNLPLLVKKAKKHFREVVSRKGFEPETSMSDIN
jgi:hypothetical protein